MVGDPRPRRRDVSGPPADAAAFIRANTRLAAPPLVPEIRLHLADEAMELWRMTADALADADIALPFWAFAWPGGQALARHLLDTPGLVAGRRVVVVAAGSGIEAIAAVRAGAASVLASDIDPFARAAMALNAAANGTAFTVTGDDLFVAAPPEADVVLLGDLCYEAPLARRVIAWARAAARRGAVVLLGEPGRAYRPTAGLEAVAVFAVPTTRAIEDAAEKRTTVWRVLADDPTPDAPAPEETRPR
jgi:predicted nicotinamide N-methyase